MLSSLFANRFLSYHCLFINQYNPIIKLSSHNVTGLGITGAHPGSEYGFLGMTSISGQAPSDALELRFFHSCQSRSAEAVREVTEFAKNIPGFIDLDLNDQVRLAWILLLVHSVTQIRTYLYHQPFTLLPGNFAEVRCDRGLNHHDVASDEQRRDPDLLRTDLHDAGVPQESQETFLSNDGTKVWVLSQVQHAGAGRQRHGAVSGCHYPQRGWVFLVLFCFVFFPQDMLLVS